MVFLDTIITIITFNITWSVWTFHPADRWCFLCRYISRGRWAVFKDPFHCHSSADHNLQHIVCSQPML